MKKVLTDNFIHGILESAKGDVFKNKFCRPCQKLLTKNKKREMLIMFKALEQFGSLSHEVEIIVCTKDSKDRLNPPKLVQSTVEHVSRLFGKRFGGFTIIEAKGGWVLPDNTLSVEKNFIIQASVSEQDFTSYNMDVIIQLAQEVKLLLDQDAVSLKVDGTRYFI